MQKSFDLEDVRLEKEFGMGCLLIKGAHLWPLSHYVWDATPTEVSATFFGELQEPWEKANLMRIEVYKLPQSEDSFEERREWYSADRKKRRIKISDGDLFEDDMLHIKGFGSDWNRDAFPLSKREVIRIYQTDALAVIFRFLAKSGTLLDHPIFKRAVKNIRVDQTQWQTNVPTMNEVRPKDKRFAESLLTHDEQLEIVQISIGARKLHGFSEDKCGVDTLKLIETKIDSARTGKKLKNDNMVDLAIELGTILGQCFCAELDWEWRRVKSPDKTESICVCSPDRSLLIVPVDWIRELLFDKKQPLNCVLTFNMIDGGRLPPSRPNAYSRIG